MALGICSRVRRALAKRFPDNERGAAYYSELLTPYAQSSLRPPNLLSELETGEEGKFWSCVWEAMLYSHLTKLNLELRNMSKRSGQDGPDFGIAHADRRIWIEAVVPAPNGIPPEFLDLASHSEAVEKPDQERLLRCTSVIGDKVRKFGEYARKGIVGERDVLVIAVSICRLSDWDPDGNGVSQSPLCMEAVFPIGPITIPLNRLGKIDGPAENLFREVVAKPSGEPVRTSLFLDPSSSKIAAVIQGHQRDLWKKDLNLSVIHNPFADNPLPVKLFGAAKEFVATLNGDSYTIRDLAALKS